MILGYVFALIIGLSLGLLGGGGSILTVPILVYLVKLDPKVSIALSLAIVGFTSLIGSYRHYRNNNIEKSTVILFAPFAMIGSYAGAFVSQFLSPVFQLTTFGIIMLSSSFIMIRGKGGSKSEHPNKIILIISGFIVGVISGVVGVGGGFLIVPALTILAGLEMRKAVGTSLVVISLSSLTGFIGYLGNIEIPWKFLLFFTFFSGLGIIIGSKLVNLINQEKLKRVFGIFLFVMGIFIIYKNI